MSLLLLREAAVLIGSGIGAYTDFKTGLIPDKITYSMVVLGVLLNIIEFEFNAFALAAIVFVAGYFLYYAGKLGGGDVKLFTGIALLMPFMNGFPFLLTALFVGAIIAVLFLSSYYVIKYARVGIDFSENRQGFIRSGLLGIVVAAYFFVAVSYEIFPINYVFVLGIPLFSALVFIAFERGIRKNFFLQKVKLNELEEDDLIAYDFLKPELRDKINLKIKGIIDGKLKNELEGLGVKEILVYRNLPKFAPFVFMGVAAAIAYPDLLMLFILR